MREIKFRVFHKPTKTMVYCDKFWICDEYSSLAWSTEDDFPNAYGHRQETKDIGEREDNFIVMQYTGLKDKNGKEIYEGDILASMFGEGKYRRELLHAVRWNDEGARFELPYPLKNFEIIGNIYENPELMVLPKTER